MELDCDADIAGLGSDFGERRFREVVYHEQHHGIRTKAAGDFCMSGCEGTATVDGSECDCWEEGRADFGALAVGRFEKSRPEFQPDRRYPDGYGLIVDDRYLSGSIWTAIYSQHLLSEGVPGIADVAGNTQLVNGSTRMVGSCTGSDVSTCPANSYYRYLLNNQNARTYGRWHSPTEISEIFHWHVTDADRAIGGWQSFPWPDEMPNRFLSSPFVKAEGTSRTYISTGPHNAGTLKFNASDDYDTVMFLGVAGETYSILTDNLTPGVDTVLEVFNFSGTTETSLAYNDDCGSRASCITFTAPSTGYFRIRVNPWPGTLVGQTATYRLSIQMSGDDYGDGRDQAAALPPNAQTRPSYGQLNTASDVDYFKITSATTQNVSYGACMTGATLTVGIVDSAGNPVQTISPASCPVAPSSVSIGAGTYYMYVRSAAGATGTYDLLMDLSNSDLDIDSTPAHAFELDPSGRTYGVRFESGTDVDWYRFPAEEGRFYRLETYALDSPADTFMELYAPSTTVYGRQGTVDSLPDVSGGFGLGFWMFQDDDGAVTSLGSRISFMAPATGNYYVKVRPYSQWNSGGYAMMFEDTGVSFGWPAYP